MVEARYKTYRDAKEWELAKTMAEVMYERDPKSFEWCRKLVDAKTECGDPTGALQLLKDEVIKFGELSNYVYAVARQYALLGLKKSAMDNKLEASIRRSMLFTLSLIDDPQAAQDLVEVARSGPDQTASLAKVLINKRDQGIRNTYKAKDMLSGKKANDTSYIDRLAPNWDLTLNNSAMWSSISNSIKTQTIFLQNSHKK